LELRKKQWGTLAFALAIILTLGACKKKEAPPPTPPPPPPPAPTASLAANPNVIEQGQSTTLSWRTENATDVTLEGMGTVEANGSHTMTPTESTTYRLTAKGPGGTQEATARVTVTAPPQHMAGPGDEEMFAQNVKDVFFDYDKYDIRPDAASQVAANAAFLAQHPNIHFLIEGHCDERGSTEYNLGLGDNRANATKEALVKGGVSADRIKTISYGKEKPVCTESNETCWQQNRRGHFVYQK
jgi:peptidoglycan-associated lipoprotein